jgi:dTMP kinase
MSEVKLGHLAVIEGNEGVGKSTVIQMVAERMRAAGHDVLVVREPGGTPFAEKMRGVLKQQGDDRLTFVTELLLFGAQRDDLYAKVVGPALKEGKVVLADRGYFSTYAWQVHPFMDNNGLLLQLFNLMTSINVAHLANAPAIVANLKLDDETRLARIAARPAEEGVVQDAFETSSPDKLAAVADAYALLEQQPGVTTFDASVDVETLADQVFDQFQVSFNQRVQEATIMREREEAAKAQAESGAEGQEADPENSAAPESELMTLEALEAEILSATQHHVEQLSGMYGGNFDEHRAAFDEKVELLKKWVKLHIAELAVKRPEGIPAMEGQQRVMQITGNIGTMLGGVMTLMNIGDMVAASEAAPAPQAPVEEEAESEATQMANEASGFARGETPYVQHVEELGLIEEPAGLEMRGGDTGGVQVDEASFKPAEASAAPIQ